MAAATRILLRAFIEANFHFFALQRDPTYLEDYLDQFLIQKKKLLQRIRLSKSSRRRACGRLPPINCFRKPRRPSQTQKHGTFQQRRWAKRAQMHDIYLTAYAVLSHAVHTGVSDIDHYIRINHATNETEGFKYGPSEVESVRVICLSGMTLAEALEIVSRDCGENRAALCAAHKEAFQSS